MPDQTRLNGWKEIAGYLKFSVRRAQYAESEGLPVRRQAGKSKSQVWAFTDELYPSD